MDNKINIFRDIKIAFDSLGHNIFRSFLTTLGIIFGVAAVISMMSIGEGAKKNGILLCGSSY